MWHLTMNNSSLDGRNGDLAVFDREDLWIRVLSNKSAGNVLVPDFNSYSVCNVCFFILSVPAFCIHLQV